MKGDWFLVTYPNGVKVVEILGGPIEIDVKERATAHPVVPVVVMTEEEHARAIEQAYQQGYWAGQGLKG